MNRSNALVAGALAAAALLAPACVLAQDMATVAPKAVKVLLDNDKARVLEVSLAPGESTGMHSHGDNIVYYLTPAEGTQTMGDGTAKPMHHDAGDILWSDPVTHDTKNDGKKPVKVLVVELKGSP